MTTNQDLLLDFTSLSLTTIFLEPEQIQQAAQLSSQIPNLDKQWQGYLNLLSLFSFEQWLERRHPKLSLNKESCTSLQPQYANLIEAVSGLQIGEFKLCLLATDTMMDDRIVIPRAVIDLPEYSNHFYVVIAVEEEQEQASIKGFITYTQLREYQQSTHLEPESDWTYEVPWTCFDSEPEHLLLYLRCLEATNLTLPKTPSTTLVPIERLQAKLSQLITNSDLDLWQLLTWSEGASFLSYPVLIDWLYHLQTETPSAQTEVSLSNQLTQILESLRQTAINVAQWLQGELDEFSRSLSWVLLPPLANASFRSTPRTNFEEIMQQLRGSGVDISPTAQVAYQDLILGNDNLRLYVVTWLVSSQETEYCLLVILGRESGEALPIGLKLQVRDLIGILVEQIINPHTEETYLYTSVIGAFGEEFIVTIALANGEELTLPSFTFSP
jgi:Protein of unknown function (DUF1822)